MLRLAARGSVLLYLANVANMAIGFFVSILLVRSLSKELYGAYQLINTLNFFLIYVASFGIDAAVLRFGPEYLTKKKPGHVNKLLFAGVSLRFILVSSLIVCSILFSNSFFAFFNFSSELKTWYPYICFYLVLSRVAEVFGQSLLNVYFEQRKIATIEFLYMVLKLVLLMVVVKLEMGFRGIVFWLIASELFTFSAYLWFASRIFIRNAKEHREAGALPVDLEYKRIWKFSLTSYLLSGTGVLREITVDNFVIAHFMNLTHVGLYGFSSTIVNLASAFNPSNVLKNVLSTLLTRKYTETRDMNHLVYGNTIVTKISLFMLMPVYVSIGFLINPIIAHIYDPKFLPAIVPIRMLLAFFFFNQLTYGFGHIFFVLERMDIRIYAFVFSVYNLVMDIWLIPKYGLVGAAFATGSTALLTYGYYYAAIKFILKVEIVFPWVSLMKIAVNMIPVLLLLWWSVNLITGVVGLLTVIFCAAALYLVSSTLLKPFDGKDRDYINAAFGRRIWVF